MQTFNRSDFEQLHNYETCKADVINQFWTPSHKCSCSQGTGFSECRIMRQTRFCWRKEKSQSQRYFISAPLFDFMSLRLLLPSPDSQVEVFAVHLSRRLSQSSPFSWCQEHSKAGDLWPLAVVSRSQPCHYPSITAALCCICTSITHCHLSHTPFLLSAFSLTADCFFSSVKVGVDKVVWFAY